MQIKGSIRGSRWEHGVTLIEQVLAALFIGFLILVWVNSIRVTTKGTIQSKNNLRAQNLALSKLEDVKNIAEKASYGNTWTYLTQNPTVMAYGVTQVSTIENKAFTWRVQTYFASLPVSSTPSATPTTSTAVTGNIWMQAEVYWQDVTGPKYITMTGYTTDIRQ
jgi:hypothetical protein